jgi:hypothetical protein
MTEEQSHIKELSCGNNKHKDSSKKKRRSKEEIIQDKLKKEEEKTLKEKEKTLKKEEKTLKKEEEKMENLKKLALTSFKLIPGKLPDALSAMKIFDCCRSQQAKVDNCFRRTLMLRKLFNPRENLNKFMTGGGAEETVHQLITSVGIDCKNVSAKATVIDLEINVPLESSDKIHCFKPSLKNSGKITSTPVLENYRGKKRHEIRELPPTFIIYTETLEKRVRIIYLDHEIVRQGYPHLTDEEFNKEVFKNEDSNLTFQYSFLKHFIPRLPEEYILNAIYPENIPECEEQNYIKLGLAVADKCLEEYDSKNKTLM